MFAGMLNRLRETVSTVLSHVEVRVQRPEDLPAQPPQRVRASHPEPASALAAAGPGPVAMPAAAAAAQAAQIGRGMINPDDPATWTNVNRNAACPCGSGKKYKYCHGKQ